MDSHTTGVTVTYQTEREPACGAKTGPCEGLKEWQGRTEEVAAGHNCTVPGAVSLETVKVNFADRPTTFGEANFVTATTNTYHRGTAHDLSDLILPGFEDVISQTSERPHNFEGSQEPGNPDPAQHAVTSPDLLMYMQFKVDSRESAATCINKFERLQAASRAQSTLVGMAVEGGKIAIIFAVNLGPSHEVKERSPQALAAFEFVTQITDKLFNYWPQFFSGEPTVEQREVLNRVIEIGTVADSAITTLDNSATTTATVSIDPDAPVTTRNTIAASVNSHVTGPDGSLWQVEFATP